MSALSLHHRLANFRCPNCMQLLPTRQMWRTKPWRMSWRASLPFHVCAACQAHLRLADQGRWRFGVASGLSFLVSALVGFSLVRNVPGLTWVDGAGQTEPTFVAFLLVMAGVVYPATALCQRLLRVEIVT